MTDYVDLVEQVFKPLAMLLGLVYFISLMLLDACVAILGKPARIWIPGKSLVISAMTIQILSYLEIYLAEGSEKEGVFLGESARVVTCVLIGYLLPGMARAGSATDRRTLAALVLSLFTSEFYYLSYGLGNSVLRGKFHFYRALTNAIILVSIILMVLFSICAILAGRTIRGMLAQKISAIQWDKSNKIKGDSWQKFEDEIVESWLVARVCHPQYVIARSLLSSAVGLVVTICILFLAILQISLRMENSDSFFEYPVIPTMQWAVAWAFILIGGAVIFCRWFMAVVYFPRFFVKKKQQRHPRPFVEDFWTRSILELVQMYNLEKWRSPEQRKKGLALRIAMAMKIHYLFSLFKPLQISLVCFSKCCFFISELLWNCLQRSDKLSSQSQSEFVKYREILEKVCMPGENSKSLWIANEKSMKQAKSHFNGKKREDFNCDKLFEFLMLHLESDDNKRFVNQLERFPAVAKHFPAVAKRFPAVAKHFPALDENCMRITAVSLLTIINKLLPLHNDVDRLTKAIEAFRQSLDLMFFVENSDPQHPTTINMLKVIDIEADRVGLAVYNEFRSLPDRKEGKFTSSQKSLGLGGTEGTLCSALETINKLLKESEEKLYAQELPITNKEEKNEREKQTVGGEEQGVEEGGTEATLCSALKTMNKLLKESVEKLHAQELPITNKKEKNRREKQTVGGEEQGVEEDYSDSRDWSAIIASYNKYKVCTLILSYNFDNENELMKYLYKSLSDVIFYCLLKLPNVMVKKCREWAVEFEEEKIWDAMCTAGQFYGLMEKCKVPVKENFLEPMFPTYKEEETQMDLIKGGASS